MTVRTITEKRGEKVLAAVKAQFASAILEDDYGPQLVMDFDWYGDPQPAISWEEGPYEWAYLFPYGGVEEEFGSEVKDVSKMLPKGVFCEAITSWAIGIYPD